MESKPVVLTFNRYYLPGYRAGGAIRTISNMVDRLGKHFDFWIVTSDRDVSDNEPYPNITNDKWQVVGNARVHYAVSERISCRYFIKLIDSTRPDVIYLNSFFDPIFTQKVLLARRFNRIGKIPIVLAPRGEFSQGALDIKRQKKKLYIAASKVMDMYRNITWQASSELERDDIEQTLGRLTKHLGIVVAPDVTSSPSETAAFERKVPRPNGVPLRVCFLSRIGPMKNLDFALQVLAGVKVPLVFTMYGPKEVQSYWETCEQLISALPKSVQVRYEGTVHPSSVRATLSQHDIFFLPTRGENYGHVIHEALGAGLPVLLSDQTPWHDVMERHVGWTLPLNSITPFVDVLESCSTWSGDNWSEISRKAMEYAEVRASDTVVLEKNWKLFLGAIAEKKI